MRASTPTFFSCNADPEEARLEAKEANQYLLAKSLFDCREYDRCAAVFLPDVLVASVLQSDAMEKRTPSRRKSTKGKSRASEILQPHDSKAPDSIALPNLSQKSLFLALYAKFMSGEKRRSEETEMIMGPQDQAGVVNKQLVVVGRLLATWLDARKDIHGEVHGSQGWLEYL